jgi:hypothetical protein
LSSTSSFARNARLLSLAFAAHVAEETPGFTSWAKRNASERYSQRDFVRINAAGLLGTALATAAVTRSERRSVMLVYYTGILTQQALFNAVFHAGTTLAFREYSPGLVTSLLNAALWPRVTRAALADGRMRTRDLPACIALAGVLHAGAVARQVFFVGVPCA